MESLPENPIGPDLPGENELKADNEVLKLKLKLEYDMDIRRESTLPAAIENKWLNNLYDFEKQWEDAKRIKVCDRLGRPSFVKVNDLKPGEINLALHRIISIMEEKGIVLDCLVDYDETVIYKFITEELFEHEMDLIEIDGYVQHYIYEEFHPNHDYDLRHYAEGFIDLLLRGKFDEFLHSHRFRDKVHFNGSEHEKTGIFAIIETFQEAHGSFEVDQFQIQQVNFDLEEGHAKVQAMIRYSTRGNGILTYEGKASIEFILLDDYWLYSGFLVPGLTTVLPE